MPNESFASLTGVSRAAAAALEEMGITSPFPIQTQVIPLAASGADVLAQAPTGSGKTLAFGLAMISRCAGEHDATRRAAPGAPGRVRGLVLVPTRELAVQVCEDLAAPAQAHSLRVAAVYGGANMGRQAAACRRADIAVATPGRLLDLAQRGDIDLGSVEVLVLDEADRMLDMGFEPQVERIVRRVPEQRQTMLFSATLGGAVGALVRRYTHDAVTVTVDADRDSCDAVDHVFEPTSHAARVDTLVDVLDTDRDLALVFVRTKRGADRLTRKLRQRGVAAAAMHGGMTQSRRLRELGQFRDGECSTLVATDVVARGIDLDNITHVVNYDPPADADTYRHRIGRTGRAGRSGTGISLVADDQLQHMLSIADEVGLREQTA